MNNRVVDIEAFRHRLGSFKAELADIAEYQAEWRDWKAEEYPADARNGNSARALRALAAELRELPDDHAALRKLWRAWREIPDDDTDLITTVQGEILRGWGFYGAESGAAAFLDHFSWELEQASADPRASGLLSQPTT